MCGVGQRNADESECLAAVVAASGGKANGHIKLVDTPLVPAGCSYSHVSGAALFNSGAGQWGSDLEDYQLVCATSDSASPSTQDTSSEQADPDSDSRPVVLGATEISCYDPNENNAQLFAKLASACAAYKELVVVVNVFDSAGGRTGGSSRSLNCAAEFMPNVTLPACVREVTHVPGMKTAFLRYALRPEDVERLAPSAEVVWLFDNDMSIAASDFDLERAVSSLLASGVSIGQPLIAKEEAASSADVKKLSVPRSHSPKVQGGGAFGSTSAAVPLPTGCRAQAVPWVEVQVPMIRADSYQKLHSKLLSKLPSEIFNHTVWGLSHVWCGMMAHEMPELTACVSRPNGLPSERKTGCYPTGCAVLDVVLADKGRRHVHASSTSEVIDEYYYYYNYEVGDDLNIASNSSDTDSLVRGGNARERGLEWIKQNVPDFWPYGPSKDILWPSQWDEAAWLKEHASQQEEVRGLDARGECLKGPAFKSVQKRSTRK